MNKENAQWAIVIFLAIGIVGIGGFLMFQSFTLGRAVSSLKILSLQVQSLEQRQKSVPVPSKGETDQGSQSSSTFALQVPSSTYVSANLGYALKVPSQWVKYGYVVTYVHSPKGERWDGNERWEDMYYTDFPDRKDFNLLIIGRMPSSIWYSRIKNRAETLKAALNAGGDVAFGAPALEDKIAETSNGSFVYYQYFMRLGDDPQQYVKDGNPMPDFLKDFKVNQ
jgi:hypothetical protein